MKFLLSIFLLYDVKYTENRACLNQIPKALSTFSLALHYANLMGDKFYYDVQHTLLD